MNLRARPVPALDAEHLAAVIELWTGIPASRVQAQELGRLNGMEDRLKQRVIGQDEAIESICTAIRRSCRYLAQAQAGVLPVRRLDRRG